MPSAGQGLSGVCIFQMWACASTMVRRAGWALAGSDTCDAIARPAPAATVVLRTSRRDNMGNSSLVVLDARFVPGGAVIFKLSPTHAVATTATSRSVRE